MTAENAAVPALTQASVAIPADRRTLGNNGTDILLRHGSQVRILPRSPWFEHYPHPRNCHSEPRRGESLLFAGTTGATQEDRGRGNHRTCDADTLVRVTAGAKSLFDDEDDLLKAGRCSTAPTSLRLSGTPAVSLPNCSPTRSAAPARTGLQARSPKPAPCRRPPS